MLLHPPPATTATLDVRGGRGTESVRVRSMHIKLMLKHPAERAREGIPLKYARCCAGGKRCRALSRIVVLAKGIAATITTVVCSSGRLLYSQISGFVLLVEVLGAGTFSGTEENYANAGERGERRAEY